MWRRKIWLSGRDDLADTDEGLSLHENGFANLVAANEALRRTEFFEYSKELAVLEHVRVNGERWRRNQFDRLRVNNAIAVKSFRRTTVKQRQNNPARVNETGKTVDQGRHSRRIEIVQKVPGENAVMTLLGILERCFQEFLCERGRRELFTGVAHDSRSQPLFFAREKIFPGPQ